MLDWLIIGGGIHGTHLALYLTQRRRVPLDRLRVLDPHPQPLALWEHHTGNVGMAYLRSGHAHNLHYDPFSLVTFSRTQAGQPLAAFLEPYGRPSLELFRAHCEQLIHQYKLDTIRLLGRAGGLQRIPGGWRVETDSGSIEAARVVLAFGLTEQPAWPAVFHPLRGTPGVHHLFDPAFDRAALPDWREAVVVGGGITAAQTALALALRAPGTVTLVMRHPPRLHQFDADPGWVGMSLGPFYADADYSRRRALIQRARYRGSMPPDVARELQTALDHRLLRLIQAEVMRAAWVEGGLRLSLTTGDLSADTLLLATGLDPRRPGGPWLDAAIEQYGLPLAPDGYPIVDQRLCWAEGLHVSGPLAELEIGPVARNIIGARLAAERIGMGL
jgi:glycine/D-amino acid oxidase-like deaminating enzyme